MSNRNPGSSDGRTGIRIAPASGDVVDHRSGKGCCGGGAPAERARPVGGCCGKDLGPLDEDREGPSDEDIEKFSDVTRECPECGKSVYDEAELCHHCGSAMSSPSRGLPTWALVAAVLLIASFAVAYLLR